MNTAERVIAGCLAGVVAGLVLVGFVSGTPLRHFIQVMPALVVLVAAVRRVTWASWAALPVFAFWFVIMLVIWLWLLGLARIITGNFTASEVALTILIGSCAVAGVVATVWSPSRAGAAGRCVSFLLFAALQVIAMWLSLQPSVSGR